MNNQLHLNRKIGKSSLELSRRYKHNLLDNPTPQEQLFAVILDSLGIEYKRQRVFFTDRTFYIADFYIPKPYKLIIEIDGGCHLSSIEKDVKRTQFFECNRNFKVVRFPNDSIIANETFREEVKNKIESLKHHYTEYKNRGFSSHALYRKTLWENHGILSCK